ncbi:MAG TPA: helicase-related protein [Gemmatimonadaceae bacterium]|nr:helicase-related protein [Gemmatimonadaceae bacterium]
MTLSLHAVHGDLALAPAECVLARIARLHLGPPEPAAAAVGGLALRPHQLHALARLRPLLARHGGALLADEVGLGKTLVAIALMREARSPVVVAPAALRPMWTQALGRAGLAAPLVTFEALSRGRSVATRPDLLVVDEAHHARTPHTRRYDALATLAAGARTLLLSATPVHNRPRDLAALLALFLGSAAHASDEGGLARHVVRHTHSDVHALEGALPRLEPPRWLDLPAANLAEERAILDDLVALPPPVAPSDGGDAGALVAYSLVRQWASSRAALRGALRRRLATAGALADALDAGRAPSRADLAAWSHADGAVQLAFAELLAPAADVPTTATREAVRVHADAVRALLARLARTPDPDVARAAALRALRTSHPAARIIAFAEREETVAAYFALLRHVPGIALLSARGGRVAGGRCTRREIIERFAPAAANVTPPGAAHRIDLLLATDLLSEGVNLQDASIVVHLDLPWSPARLEQRVGRVRRLGSAHERVHVYLMPPPAESERVLAVERRLRRKLADAGRLVGVAGAVLPSLLSVPDVPDATPQGEAEEWTRVRALLAPWADQREGGDAPTRGVAAAGHDGWIALVHRDGATQLVAAVGEGAPSESPAAVRAALESLRPREPAPGGARERQLRVQRASTAAAAWLARHAAASLVGLGGAPAARARRRVLDRIAAVGAAAGRHRRAPLAPLLAEARRAALAPLGAGAERVLDALAASALDDEAWLRTVATFGRLHAPGGALARDHPEAPRLLALLVLMRP